MRRAALLAVLLLAGCTQQAEQQPSPRDARISANPEKYARDRDLCRDQVAEATRTRRNIDDSRREVFSGDADRIGRNQLPSDMANYDDQRRSDRLMESCMESRGWPQPQRPWWQR